MWGAYPFFEAAGTSLRTKEGSFGIGLKGESCRCEGRLRPRSKGFGRAGLGEGHKSLPKLKGSQRG